MAAGLWGTKGLAGMVLVSGALGCPVFSRAAEVNGGAEGGQVKQVDSIPNAAGTVRWAMMLSTHVYRESGMGIAGPALGLRAETLARVGDWPVKVEGEFSAGLANYSSSVSGAINGLPRLGSMLHLSGAAADEPTWVPRPGLGLTTEWTDLRGVFATGSGAERRYFNGYERFNASIWLSGSWDLERERPEGALRLRAALLLAGWQRSLLSQAVAGYADVTNRQHRGVLLSLERPLRFDGIDASLRAGIRLVGRSDLVKANAAVWIYEPDNRTLEIAVTLWH